MPYFSSSWKEKLAKNVKKVALWIRATATRLLGAVPTCEISVGLMINDMGSWQFQAPDLPCLPSPELIGYVSSDCGVCQSNNISGILQACLVCSWSPPFIALWLYFLFSFACSLPLCTYLEGTRCNILCASMSIFPQRRPGLKTLTDASTKSNKAFY